MAGRLQRDDEDNVAGAQEGDAGGQNRRVSGERAPYAGDESQKQRKERKIMQNMNKSI